MNQNLKTLLLYNPARCDVYVFRCLLSGLMSVFILLCVIIAGGMLHLSLYTSVQVHNSFTSFLDHRVKRSSLLPLSTCLDTLETRRRLSGK